MTNSMKAGIIGWLAGLAVAILVAVAYFSLTETDPQIDSDSGAGASKTRTASGTEPVRNGPEPLKVVKHSVPVAAADRIVPRVMKGEFGLTGRGEDAKWGIASTANFKYTMMVIADSDILEKKTLPGGEIKVTEVRTFNRVQDGIVVSDADMKLALDTLPVRAFAQAVDAAATLWTSMTADASGGAMILSGKKYVMEKLRKIDGTGARALLGSAGLAPTPEAEAEIGKVAGAHVLKALGGIRSISGKSYRITYYQKASGVPLHVTFTCKDGSEVTDEEERMVLKRVNAFIDHNVIPDKECAPGDSWDIQAKDMQEVFDPYVEGTYSGTVRAVRKENAPNGDWKIELAPSGINVVNDNGNTNGHLDLKRGYALVDPKLVSVNDLCVAGKAKLEKLSKHHFLFTARISGECDFQGRVVTTPKK